MTALLLIALTLVAELALPVTGARDFVLAMLLGAALAALSIVYLASRSLGLRVRRLKLLVEGFPGGASKDRQVFDSSDELAGLEHSLAAR